MKKKHKRLVSFLLAIPVVANLIFSGFGTANAADAEGAVHLTKTVTLQADGTYTVDLSGFVTGETVTSSVTSYTPLDVVLVLDASSSMRLFKNTPDTYTQTDDIPGWGSATQAYPADTTKTTNLWSVFNHNTKFYKEDTNTGWGFYAQSSVEGSILIPVKPGDKIYCSSFQEKSVTGSSANGIRVTYFRSSGNMLSSLSAADVYQEFSGNKNKYITVPNGAYVMNIAMWSSDQEKVVKNLSLGEDRYNPVSPKEFAAMRAKVLQQQVQAFADALAANSLETGVEHKMAIVTFGGGGTGSQGYYRNHVAVNGFGSELYTNTGMFVDGKFINYYDSATDGTALPSYTPVFAAELDQTKTYYYFEASKTNNYGTIREVTYDTATSKWVNSDGTVIKPQPSPYAYNSYTQLHDMEMVVPGKPSNSQERKALTNVLVDGQLNPNLQFAIDRYVSKGTTHTEMGLAMADLILAENAPRAYTDPVTGKEGTSKQIVILFTDGQTSDPDNYDADGNAVAADDKNGIPSYQTIFYRSNRIKHKGATIYTISVADEETGNVTQKWMDQVSSNHTKLYTTSGGNPYGHTAAKDIYDSSLALTNGKYYMNIENVADLDDIFESITTDISSSKSNVSLGKTAVMQDYLANGLIFPEDFGFNNITLYTETIKTKDGITYTRTNKRPFTNNGDGTYTLGGTTVTVAFNKNLGLITATGFDYSSYFVSTGQNGNSLILEIRGVEATEETPTDALLDTNTKQSGIAYKDSEGKSGLYPFEQPKTQLASKTYVMDYAKPMTISAADWGNVIGIADSSRLNLNDVTAVSLDEIVTDYGTFAKNGDSYTFTPSTMQWDQPASFYVLRTLATEDVPAGVTTGVNQWMRINVVPANNIYYEDDFAGIDYTGNWTTDGTVGNSTENPEGSNGDAEGVHGWEENLKDQQYSDGLAHMGMVSADTKAEATFTFTGTGVDIYSRTNTTTGTVLVTLRGGKYHEEYGGYYEVSKTLIVDNISESGDYYQIPTVFFMDLPYDTYTVTIRVTTAAPERFAYYLDGIRIYKPLQEDIGYAVAEQGARVSLIRDLLAANGKDSAVFIDKTEDGTVGALKDYNATEYGIYGPKNEVYLAPGQSITFKVDIREDAYYYVGLKCPTGSGNAVAKVSNGAETALEIGISHATDLYYLVTPDAEGYITIQNTGTGLLSVTKLRIAGPSENPQILTVSEDEAVFAVRRFAMRTVLKKDGSFNDDWSPDTSDAGIPMAVWFVLIGACVALPVMVATRRRAGYEA